MLIGWDISTSAIGICIKNDDDSVIKYSVIFPIGNSHLEKHIDAAEKVKIFCKENNVLAADTKHFIEERLGGFSGGKTTRQTLMALAAMNAVISFVLNDYGSILYLHPLTTKKIMKLVVPKGENKKNIVIKLVKSLDPHFPYAETKSGKWKKGVDDMADAWLLASAGFIIGKNNGQKNKIKRYNKKIRETSKSS